MKGPLQRSSPLRDSSFHRCHDNDTLTGASRPRAWSWMGLCLYLYRRLPLLHAFQSAPHACRALRLELQHAVLQDLNRLRSNRSYTSLNLPWSLIISGFVELLSNWNLKIRNER